MKFSEALDNTLHEYGISAKWLSERSGVSQQMISQFRLGRQRVYSDSLEKIITSLPGEAREYYFKQLGATIVVGELDIDQLSNRQLSRLLVAIADRLESSRANSPLKELMSA